MAQSVKHPTLAQVMISRFMCSTPMLGSVLTAQSLEPASDSVFLSLSVSLSVPRPPLSVKNKQNKTKKKVGRASICTRR